ncbi:GNAT family N-acetyltransferase [Enterococcus sp. AZ109]|uniref:GNAT family N-acetyltransferase n=1 Tax=Enterococcus sp. AZ109 TaxID=2774634 RepID=UPI003F2470FA
MNYQDWLVYTRNSRSEETRQSNWVPSTVFFALRKSDHKIIGIIDIRHHIDHPLLRNYAGHIGYAVRPTERRKGYATEILNLGLGYAEILGLSEVMLGCHADNLGSIRTIEQNSGVLIEEKMNDAGQTVCLYWIQLGKTQNNQSVEEQ